MSDWRIESDPPLSEMRKLLHGIDGRWNKQLQKSNKKIAVWVADEVESDYDAAHPAQSGEGSGSIRARATQTEAAVWMGSEAAPYVLGQNFGSNQGPHKQQFPERQEPDYFLYANLEENYGRIKSEHLKGVDEVFENAFPDWASGVGLG